MFTQITSLFLFSLLASMAVSSAIASNDQCNEETIMSNNNQNVLQKHVAFFDRNKDGVIYPWETFQGFRAIGCGIGLSTVAALFINMGLSGKTRPASSFNLKNHSSVSMILAYSRFGFSMRSGTLSR
ncbi:hypothetical protein C5167_023243 [Papaver somniferum]|uniref:EF-hand domain-containing protein n=1 Tax=Papaver somniferum TaxID=3469 RepID=A0A4Y7JL46_PAPSO|nr:hypothetical protein C5167_023243 [Papaver somniferum]